MRVLLFVFALLLLFSEPVFARKKLPARKGAVVSASGLPQTALKLRGDKQGLLLVLTNLSQAKAVKYLLTYQAAGVGQGVEGSHDPALGNTQKELVFGTCSGNVCTYHQNISDMLFEATIGLNNGKTLIRKYQIAL